MFSSLLELDIRRKIKLNKLIREKKTNLSTTDDQLTVAFRW